MKHFLLWGSLALISLGGCDVIEDPVVPARTGYREDLYGPPPEFPSVDTPVQHVLLEDFTAHQCGNCPDAARIAEELAASRPELAVCAIHAGNLALTDDDHFDTDWTTEEGDVFWSQLDFQANPLGRVNRAGGPGNFFAPAQWEAEVDAALAAPARVHLALQSDYVAAAGHLNVHVHGQFFDNVAGPLNLAVLVLESDLVDYQLDYSSTPEVVPDYVFKHVLRGSLNGALGTGFGTASDGASTGDKALISFTYNWNEAWVLENSTLLAVLTGPDGTVINVVEQELGE
jgi:hypothetical protein